MTITCKDFWEKDCAFFFYLTGEYNPMTSRLKMAMIHLQIMPKEKELILKKERGINITR